MPTPLPPTPPAGGDHPGATDELEVAGRCGGRGSRTSDSAEEPTRRAMQQAAVAAFGLFALESRDVAVTVAQALAVVTRELNAPMACVVRLLSRSDRLAMLASRGRLGLAPQEEFEVDSRLLSIERTTHATVVQDWAAESRFWLSPAWTRAGIKATLSVTLLVEGCPWGRLTVMDIQAHRFGDLDVDFAQSMAHMLAAALERARVEHAQAAVVQLGQFALASPDAAATVQRAVEVATELLNTPMGGLFRLAGPASGQLVHRTGPIGLSTQGDADLIDQVTSSSGALAATVLARGRPWGHLVVMDVRPRLFSGSELDVLQSVANVLAAAMERHRVEDMHAEVAAFGRFALDSRDITATLERAVDVVTRALEAPVGALVELLGPGRVAVLHSQGRVMLGPGEEFEIDPELLTTYVSSEPLTVRTRQSESRLSRTQAAQARPGREREPRQRLGRSRTGRPADSSSSLSVTVPVDGRPWGRLIVSYNEPRPIGSADVDFVQSVAHVLAAALERERVDAGRAATAAFGAFALASRDLAATMERAVDLVTRVLETPLGAVIKLRSQPDRLLLVQGWGPIGLDPGHGYDLPPDFAGAVRSEEPLLIEDWRTDDRFTTSLLARSSQSLASLSMPLTVGGRVWGRLMVADTRPRRFSDTEVDLLSSVAKVLAAAMERQQEQGLRSSLTAGDRQEALRMDPGIGGDVARRATEVAVLNGSGVIVAVNGAWESFCRDNGGDPTRTGVGMSYLTICDDQDGDPVTRQIADAVRAAIRGDLPVAVVVQIPCHSPRVARWFDMLISSRLDDHGHCVGATITLSPIRAPSIAGRRHAVGAGVRSPHR
jgi:GAF domain-containing protein